MGTMLPPAARLMTLPLEPSPESDEDLTYSGVMEARMMLGRPTGEIPETREATPPPVATKVP
jgi:hypothetical protein